MSSGWQGLIDGDDVDKAIAIVDDRQDALGWMGATEAGEPLSAGAIGGQIHSAHQQMSAPGAGKLVCAFFRDQEVASKRSPDLGLLAILASGEIRRLMLGVILQECQESADLQIFAGKLGDIRER
jgi:hypothetical protein